MFQCIPGKIYNDPAVFGPAVNELQDINGDAFNGTLSKVQKYSAAYRSDAGKLASFLPSGYELAGDYILINYENEKDVSWLSGRSFHRLDVQIPVRIKGRQGLFSMVTWEDNGDDIIFRRDVHGIPAEYADFQIEEGEGRLNISLSSWGFEFLRVQFSEGGGDYEQINIATGAGTFNFRYVPKTGEGFIKHDICYTTFLPASAKERLTKSAAAEIQWTVPNFEQVPIQHTFIKHLAALPVGEIISCGMCRFERKETGVDRTVFLEENQTSILDPDKMYMMPANMDACVSPRRRTDGKRYIYDNPINTTRYAVVYEVEHPEKLDSMIPEGLERSGNHLIVAVDYLSEIAWLAQKQYALLTVNIPVKSKGVFPKDIKGAFMCCIWENEMDPILTGREQLGFCKILCEIDPPVQDGHIVTVTAKEYGNEFLRIEADLGKGPQSLLKMATKANTGKGIFHYKYFPRVGDPGKADVNCLVIQPPEDLPSDVPKVPKKEMKLARGGIKWTALDEKQSPAHTRIISTLAGLGVKKVYGAAWQHFYTLNDLFNQQVVKEYKK